MKDEHIRSFVMRYLEAEQCSIVEVHPAYVTVKLSPSADKELTYRPYYWSFVERTGVVPETMTCTFIFDPEAYKAVSQTSDPQGPRPYQPHPSSFSTPGAGATASAGHVSSGAASLPSGAALVPGAVRAAAGSDTAAGGSIGLSSPAADSSAAQPQHAPDSILGRYFGFVPTQVTARVPKEEVTFGSRRLRQIFDAVRGKGRFVHLYEQFQPDPTSKSTTTATATVAYENWLQLNFKIDMACDMKRSEIHSLGIHLGTGEIRPHFQQLLLNKHLTPRLPSQVFVIPDKITLARAVIYLEEHVERLLRTYDHSWAEEAGSRLQEELDRIHSYYEPLLGHAEPEFKSDLEAQYTNRKQEIEWQYQPRIAISVINCGLFHLRSGHLPNA